MSTWLLLIPIILLGSVLGIAIFDNYFGPPAQQRKHLKHPPPTGLDYQLQNLTNQYVSGAIEVEEFERQVELGLAGAIEPKKPQLVRASTTIPIGAVSATSSFYLPTPDPVCDCGHIARRHYLGGCNDCACNGFSTHGKPDPHYALPQSNDYQIFSDPYQAINGGVVCNIPQEEEEHDRP